MRPVDKGDFDRSYNKHGDAKPDLTERLGKSCSYCERKLPLSALEVEHVSPKSRYDKDKNHWKNLLLACKTCNTIKSNKDVPPDKLDDYLWPDTDNTFQYLKYTPGGCVACGDNLSSDLQKRVEKTILLTGLDRTAGHCDLTPRDDRWMERLNEWGRAREFRNDLNSVSGNAKEMIKKYIINHIKDSAHAGKWSIFMTVFHDNKEMKGRIIKALPRTAENCFDSDYNCVDR